MIRSMTGYGRANLVIDNKDITVEMKSVNHRFFDFNCRLPRSYGFLEEKLKSFLQKVIARGKVDIFVSIVSSSDDSVTVAIDKPLLSGYIRAFQAISEEYGVENDTKISVLSRFSDIFTVKKEAEDNEIIWNAVKTVTDEALGGFLAMRENEGQRLKTDIEENLAETERIVAQVEERSPKTLEEYRARITQRVMDVLEDKNIDESRILTECAIFADRIAVNEETVRLSSHIKEFRKLLSEYDIGKKLDFVVQEMNREVNTIGSKANDLEITKMVVNMKSLIEKIREQIQNIE